MDGAQPSAAAPPWRAPSPLSAANHRHWGWPRARMGQLDQPSFDRAVRGGCPACGGAALEIRSFIDRSVVAMAADPNDAGRWVHDGEKFVDGTYRIACASCARPVFESADCPRCHAPGGLARALGEPSRLAVPKRCPKCGELGAARDRARAGGGALRRRRGAAAAPARRLRRAGLPRRCVRVRRVRSRGRRRGLPDLRRAGAAAPAPVAATRSARLSGRAHADEAGTG